MKHYTKPPIKKPNAEVVIIYTITTNRDSALTKIATNVMDLAADVKKSIVRRYHFLNHLKR